jgi:hypothetical protein
MLQEASWCSTPRQEHHDYIKTIEASTHGFVWIHYYISIGGNKYGLVIVHDFSRFTWVFFLQDKSEAQGIIKKFIRRAQNEYELKIKNVRSSGTLMLKNFLMK